MTLKSGFKMQLKKLQKLAKGAIDSLQLTTPESPNIRLAFVKNAIQSSAEGKAKALSIYETGKFGRNL